MTKTDKTPSRPPLPADEKKTRWIQVRVSKEEHDRFVAAAAAKGWSVGKLVRKLLERSAAQLV